MRRPFLVANWKMQKGRAAALAFARAFLPRLADDLETEVAIAPPFVALDALGRALAGSPVALAAQNVHPESQGAFTGEIAPAMLVEAGCSYAIVGHSERRVLFGEQSAFVADKVAALLAHDIAPIVCVGESLEAREAGRSFEVIGAQLEESLATLPPARAAVLVMAYEPRWAIGTGRTATPGQAQEVHAMIRARLVERFGAAGDAIRIQYGGSVKPDNVAALLAEPDIDGALVGGASLEPESFAALLQQSGGPR